MAIDVRKATINTQTRSFVRSAAEYDRNPKFSDTLLLFYREKVILGASFVDDTGAAVVFNASDEFELSVDAEFEHVTDPGSLDNPYSGAVTSIAITFDADPGIVDTSGTLVLRNDNQELENVAYTAVSGTGVNRTFTVSTTLQFAYAAGDFAAIQDKLMIELDDTAVDIPGDWSEIDRATGKVSFRIDCSSTVFLDKLEEEGLDNNNQLSVILEIKQYISGETVPVVLCQDIVYARNIVRDLEV